MDSIRLLLEVDLKENQSIMVMEIKQICKKAKAIWSKYVAFDVGMKTRGNSRAVFLEL